MTDYKSNKIIEFRRLINSKLKSRFKKKLELEEKEEELQKLIVEYGGDLFGRMYYVVIEKLGDDIDDFCETLFFDHQYQKQEYININNSRLAKFLAFFTTSEIKIAKAANIEKGRLNRIKNTQNNNDDLYAYEVYALAKSFNLLPSLLFKYLYGEDKELSLKIDLVEESYISQEEAK